MMKKAELILTSAWQKQSGWLTALSPLAKAYQAVSTSQKNAYLTGKKQPFYAPVPVLVIGNITVGGSGKTPLLIALVNYLHTLGVKVGVISRGYGGDHQKMPLMVTPQSQPKDVGDEPCLIVQSLAKVGIDVPMAVCPKRSQAVELLMHNHPQIQLIISDDGLQHYALHRDDEWIVVDVARGFGNQKLLPQGFLREPLTRLDGAKVIYHYADEVSAKQDNKPCYFFLKPSLPKSLIDDKRILQPCTSQPCKVYALTGIGYPKRFFDTVKTLGFEVVECPKPDHYVFVLEDVKALQDLPILVTAKDAVKLSALIDKDNQALFENVWVVEVEVVLSDGVKQLADELMALIST